MQTINSNIKLQFKKEVHLYRGESSIEELKNFIKKSFKKLPENFNLSYTDEEGDQITVSCKEDIEALQQVVKNPKLQIQEPVISDFEELTEEKVKEEKEKESEEDKVEKLRKVQEAIQKKKEERKAKREQKRKELFQNCKYDQNMSQMMQKIQKKVTELQPELQEFLNTDFTFQEPTEEQKEAMKKQQEEVGDKFEKAPFFMKHFIGKFMGPTKGHPQSGKHWKHPNQRPENQSDSQYQQQVPPPKHLLEGFFKGFMGPHHPLRHHQEEFKEVQQVIHRHVICDGCSQRGIVGSRFKCAVCPDFDFCLQCKDTKEHPHQFIEIEKPGNKMGWFGIKKGFRNKKGFSPKNCMPCQRKNFEKKTQQPQSKQEVQAKDKLVQENPNNQSNESNLGVGQSIGDSQNKLVENVEEKLLEEKPVQCVQKELAGELNQKFGKNVQQKAKTISEVLGGDYELYLGVCAQFKNQAVDQIVGRLLENPNLVDKHSSYKK